MKEKDMANTVSDKEIEEIIRFTRKDISRDEIYTFPIVLCDNDVDRDMEKFTVPALEKLAGLFVGKTGIFDHRMSSKDQTARIYRTEVVRDETRTTADGEVYTYVKAMAYMLRSDKNKDLIDEIEAGIKKETSVNCSVKSIRCSVCGKDIKTEGCSHEKGAVYGGKTCCYLLCEPQDAYEWSFVAVPAQKNAGVIKSYGGAKDSGTYEVAEEIRRELCGEIKAFTGEILPGIPAALTEKICSALTLRDLKTFRDSLSAKHGALHPPVMQLMPSRPRPGAPDNNEYRI